MMRTSQLVKARIEQSVASEEVVDDVVAEYEALAKDGGTILGRKIVEVITVNGVRVALEDGETGRANLLDADGTALIIHANADDQVSQPIGGAGGRFFCGVIGAQ